MHKMDMLHNTHGRWEKPNKNSIYKTHKNKTKGETKKLVEGRFRKGYEKIKMTNWRDVVKNEKKWKRAEMEAYIFLR